MPLTLAPVRETVPKGILTGRLMKVFKAATLDVPVATLRLLAQAFSHVSRSNVLVYFLHFFLYLYSSFNNPYNFPWIMFRQ